MRESRAETEQRSPSLVGLGWITLFVLYWLQVCLFVSFLLKHLDNRVYAAWFLWFVPAFVLILVFFRANEQLYADEDETILAVWIIWGTYIVAYVITVAVIFGKVAHKLTKDEDVGINALLGTLCITPGMLVLLLQLMICPSYRKPVLSLSIFSALNIFDGIEMLEIFLMQKEGNFDLGKDIEICIVVFSCLSFLFSPFGLIRNKFMINGAVQERKELLFMVLGPLEIIGTNLPFLVLRAIIWHKYEAVIFIVKNAVALVVGGVEFLILKGKCKCKGNSTRGQLSA
ncbi:Hypothetical predicted protein [Paramuricea clavata]|uniref:Uncharacterized protein n=1 Tax=Paramuricea clavata TaxID=317549 RepID=A0A7D9JWH7_PARCT|nr:Hypothetical predicted protein [Paramuricea clavata]